MEHFWNIVIYISMWTNYFQITDKIDAFFGRNQT